MSAALLIPAGDPPGAEAGLSAAALADIGATLVQVFERVLQRGPVGLDDDFFDLGGNSILGIQLIQEVKKATGQDLPITTIYDAPTPGTMAALVAGGMRHPGKCLVLLKPGDIAAPLFIIHGLGGSVMELRALANRIGTGRAVFGIEARGMDGASAPLDRIEDMAGLYVEEIRRAQPAGPYLLAGFSFGGLVALEMAQILRGQGETTALLAFLDTYPHTRYWPLGCRVKAWLSFTKFYGSGKLWRWHLDYHLGVLRAKRPHQIPGYVLSRAAQAFAVMFDIFRLGDWVENFTDPDAPTMASQTMTAVPEALSRVQRAGKIAFAAYRPRPYDGPLTYVKATGTSSVQFDARALWGGLVRDLSIHTVPGNHKDLVKTSAPRVARLFEELLTRETNSVRSEIRR